MNHFNSDKDNKFSRKTEFIKLSKESEKCKFLILGSFYLTFITNLI